MSEPIVTREWLRDYCAQKTPHRVMHMVGRALVALTKRQTEEERTHAYTKEHNGIGFAAPDAKSGTLTARYYLKWGELRDWQVEKWTRVGKNGYPRIAKYARQLNEIAEQKTTH